MAINFYTDGLDYLLRGKGRIRAMLKELARTHGARIITLDYILCDKRRIRQLNVQYLNHEDYTDVITFPYSEGEFILSEIYICLPVIRENAERFGVSHYEELLRVIIHGMLHLVGFKDGNESEQLKMRQEEDRWLQYFHAQK